MTADIDTGKIGYAVNDFWNSTSGGTCGYSEVHQRQHFLYIYHKNGKLTKQNFTQSGVVLSKLDLENTQWVNFNLPVEDRLQRPQTRTATPNTGWTELTEEGVSFPGLPPGAYTVLFWDTNNKQNTEVVAQRNMTVENRASVMDTESNVEHDGSRDGSITVTVRNGWLEIRTYQFLIRPAESEESKLLWIK